MKKRKTTTTPNSPRKQKSFVCFSSSSSNEDDEEEALLNDLVGKEPSSTTSTTTSSSSSDEEETTTTTTTTIQRKRSRFVLNDEDDDEEDASPAKKNDDINRKQQPPIFLLEDTDDEEEDTPVYHNHHPSTEDMDAQRARMVLETAQALRARILQRMQEWKNNTKKTASLLISKQEIQQLCNIPSLPDYQLEGINWLALLHQMEPCPIYDTTTTQSSRSFHVQGILADEMGLGKTCQTICFLAWLCHRNSSTQQQQHPHMVVAPASVVDNWIREFHTFAPHLNVVSYHGTQKERFEIQQQLLSSSSSLDVLVCSMTHFQKEKSDDRSFLRKHFQWDYLVVDEGHALKNSKGLRYRTLHQLRTQHRLLLTGTPVQNSPKELFSLLCFLMPIFAELQSASNNHDDPASCAERMLQHLVQEDTTTTTTDERTAYEKLKQLFAPFVLRRRKEQVLHQIMPPKERVVEFVPLNESSRQIYESIILQSHLERKKLGEHLFTQLRKAAQHPLLLRTRHTKPEEKEHMAECFRKYGAFREDGSTTLKMVQDALEEYNDFEIHLTAHELLSENKLRAKELDRYILNKEDLFASPKFVRLREMLPTMIAEGHRILIFSGWTTSLDLISCLLEEMDVPSLRMDGSTKVSERQALIDEFNKNESIPVFLLSTRACGLGINLTAADTCIMHDIDFNPFNDLQAEDRCHRIGQKKPVKVIRMVTKDTVDQDIYDMQQRKEKMNAAIMESGSSDDMKEEKKQVLQTALNRFLQSPSGSCRKQKPAP